MVVQGFWTNTVNLCEIFGLDLYINKNLGIFVETKTSANLHNYGRL